MARLPRQTIQYRCHFDSNMKIANALVLFILVLATTDLSASAPSAYFDEQPMQLFVLSKKALKSLLPRRSAAADGSSETEESSGHDGQTPFNINPSNNIHKVRHSRGRHHRRACPAGWKKAFGKCRRIWGF